MDKATWLVGPNGTYRKDIITGTSWYTWRDKPGGYVQIRIDDTGPKLAEFDDVEVAERVCARVSDWLLREGDTSLQVFANGTTALVDAGNVLTEVVHADGTTLGE